MADLPTTVPTSATRGHLLVHREVLSVHEQLQALLEQSAAPAPTADPRAPVRALDAALALLCEHLAAVEAVLHPAARHRLPDQGAAVAASVASTRRAQRSLRAVQQQLWGDSRGGSESRAELAQDLRRVLEQHRGHDEELARLLDLVLTDDGRAEVVGRLEDEARRAPTRPHPHLPHRGPLAPLARRWAGRWDDVLDVMDVRRVEGRRPAAPPRSVGLWGSYLLGRALPGTTGRAGSRTSSDAAEQPESLATR